MRQRVPWAAASSSRPHVGALRLAAQCPGQPPCVVLRLCQRVASGFDQQPGAGRCRQQLRGRPTADERQQLLGQALHRERSLGEQRRHGRGSGDVVARTRAPAGTSRPVAVHSRIVAPATTTQVPSVPTKRPGNIEATLRQQPVQRVARDAPWPGCELAAEQVLMGGSEPPERLPRQPRRRQCQRAGVRGCRDGSARPPR